MRITTAVAAILLALALATPARADLAPGSLHPLLVGKARTLAMPLPAVRQVPTLRQRADGRIVVRARVDYRAANWHARDGRLRDRATIALQVARRLRTTGPDPSSPRYRQARMHLLGQRLDRRAYRWVLPRAVSHELVRLGAFSRDGKRRAAARRRVWIDVEQDRDFAQVDGAYDWREGRAANASERRPRHTTARAAASNNPGGTLTVQNATSWGFLAPGQSPIDSSFYSNAPAATVNNSGVPLIAAASAMQCFDSGSSSSNPAGFANADATGTPQPYPPGATLQGAPDDPYPFSTGFSITEPIAADDSIARASNNEQADAAAYIDGTMNLFMATLSVFTGGGTPSGWMGGANLGFLITGALDVDTIPSPGTIVSAFVDIADAIIASSCDGNANLLGVAAAEPGGGVVASNTQIQENVYVPFDPQSEETSNDVGYTAPIGGLFGLQVNQSTSTYQGSPLFLSPYLVGAGVSPNSLAGSGNNYMGFQWVTSNPCPQYGEPDSACTALPAAQPPVADAGLNVDCGTSNLQCPFPGAGFPPGTTPLPSAASVAPPAATTISGTTTTSGGCATQVPASGTQYGAASAVFSPSGVYELLMTSAGVLELIDTQADQIVWLAPSITANGNHGPVAGSTWSMQAGGDFVISGPGGDQEWDAGSSAAGGFLAVQNDGTVVVWSPDGTSPLWASGPPTGAACPSPASAQAAPARPTDSCATLIAPSDTSAYPPGTSFTSPNGVYQLTMLPSGILQLANTSTGATVWNSSPSFTQPSPATPAYSAVPGTTLGVTTSVGIQAGQFATNVSAPALFVAVQNDGNLVVYSATGAVLWATGTFSGTPCPAPSF
jgi:hypothetical protein